MVDAQHPQEASTLLSELEPWAQSQLLEPVKSNFYFNRANVAAQLGDHITAIENYTTSLQLSVHMGAYFNRANSYASIGEYDKAIADYQSCQDYAGAMFNAGNSYVAKLEFENAEQCYATAAQQEPMRAQLSAKPEHHSSSAIAD